jgi:hypothetical protein
VKPTWQSFLAEAIVGAPDDPFVRSLKRRLASGYTVDRVNLAPIPNGVAYSLLLSYQQALSRMEVPHSPSFTRWSLANGIKMASREEEERRWALLAAERFQPVAEQLGAEYATSILLERLRALGPPRTTAALAEERTKATEPGREQARAIRVVDDFIHALAQDLSGALGYSAEETAEILDGAMEQFAPQQVCVERSSRAARVAAALRPGRAGVAHR